MEHVTPVTSVIRSRTALALPFALLAALVSIALVALIAAAPRGVVSPGGAPNGLLAAAAIADPSAAAASPGASGAVEKDADAGWKAGAGLQGAGLGRGGPVRGGPGRGPITITAINGAQLSLRTDNGWSRTIDASDATIRRGETEIALADLRVDDQIAFREVRTSDGTSAITVIGVLDPSVTGQITGITDSSVTVRLLDGTPRTIQTTSATVYRAGRDTATRDALAVGHVLRAVGTRTGDTFTATEIRIAPAMVAGEVTAKTAATITVTDPTGASRTINVAATTTYRIRGDDTPSLADIAVGDRIAAQGDLTATGALDATIVAEGHIAGDGRGDRGGPGHRGPRPGGQGGGAPNATPAPSASGSASSG
jgi:hypothetical protein